MNDENVSSGLRSFIVFLFLLVIVIGAPMAIVGWRSVNTTVASAAPKVQESAPVAPTDDDNLVIWRKISTGGNVHVIYQPAYDRYRVISRGVDNKVEWTKNCEPASAGRFAYTRHVPEIPGTRVICLEPK